MYDYHVFYLFMVMLVCLRIPTPVVFFIHYLLRSGKPLRFPATVIVQDCYKRDYEYPVCKVWDIGGDVLCRGHIYSARPLIYTDTFSDFNAVGKFIYGLGVDMETGKLMEVYLDRYEFYDWCGNLLHYKYNCNCNKADVSWNQGDKNNMAVTIFPTERMKRWLYKNGPRKLLYWLEKHSIQLYDRNFIGKGKPFLSYKWREFTDTLSDV